MQTPKPKPDQPPMTLEELARRMLATPHKDRAELTKKKAKPRRYAGTQPAHLFYSDDLGKRWSELPGLRQVPGVEHWTFPVPPRQAHAKSIAFHPNNPNIIHVAVEVGGF